MHCREPSVFPGGVLLPGKCLSQGRYLEDTGGRRRGWIEIKFACRCAHTCTLHYRGSYAGTGIYQNWAINRDPGWGSQMTKQGQKEEEI